MYREEQHEDGESSYVFVPSKIILLVYNAYNLIINLRFFVFQNLQKHQVRFQHPL